MIPDADLTAPPKDLPRGLKAWTDRKGDLDPIFGVAKLNLKIVDRPIRYRKRVHGDTSISRWTHGFLLLRVALFAMGRIEFI